MSTKTTRTILLISGVVFLAALAALHCARTPVSPTLHETPSPPTLGPSPSPTASASAAPADRPRTSKAASDPSHRGRVARRGRQATQVFTCETAQDHLHGSNVVEAGLIFISWDNCLLRGTITGTEIALFGQYTGATLPPVGGSVHVRYCRVCGQISYARF